jgi:tetratricopeptide (TPR) repeat protein
LREAARALTAALKAVTSRPADEADLFLPEVSRRSPLGSWKALINAIAAFYRRDDTSCRRWLQTVTADSVPARLVPVMQVMLGSEGGAGLNSAAAQNLVAAIGAGEEALRQALADLEAALAAQKKPPILERARTAISACERFRPDLRDRLRQYISVRCMVVGFRPNQVRRVLGGTPRTDARWYQLMATALESSGYSESLAHALIAWETFRAVALEEKWFAAKSLEDGVLLLHMAGLAARVPADLADELLLLTDPEDSISQAELTPGQLFSPDVLYERACAADPHSEAFQVWLDWAKKQRDWRAADQVAERWQQACEKDVAPLLWLMESCEKRGAYQKSLKYLHQAEQLDRLNPEVRKAKLRLLLADVLRHFRQRKPHLAKSGIERIESLLEPAGSLAGFTSALRRVCAALEKDHDAVRRHRAEAEGHLGNPVAAYVVDRGIVDAAVLAPEEALLTPLDLSSYTGGTLLKGLAKACLLGDSVGLPAAIPENWKDRLRACCMDPAIALDTAEMLVLGEATIRSRAPELAFAVSVRGLARGGADARFLFLRARSLPPGVSERRSDCLSAALELAHREGNKDLAGKLLEELRGRPGNMFEQDDFAPGPEGYSMETGFLNEVLADERAQKQYPMLARHVPASNGIAGIPVNHPRPNHVFYEREEFPEEEEEDLADFEDFLANMPPELRRELTLAIARGASPEAILKRILSGRSWELESLLKILPRELAREIKKAIANGATAEQILNEIEAAVSDRDSGRTAGQRQMRNKGKSGAGRPQQGSLF